MHQYSICLCSDQFNHSSKQAKRDPVDLVTVDYDQHFDTEF